MEINLNTFRTAGAGIFAGRSRGVAVRQKVGEETIDRAEKLELLVPDDVFSINSSFILGLFGKTIRLHKKEGFLKRFSINTPDFDDSINDAIREALEEDVLL